LVPVAFEGFEAAVATSVFAEVADPPAWDGCCAPCKGTEGSEGLSEASGLVSVVKVDILVVICVKVNRMKDLKKKVVTVGL
jgi:hypothetical protein